MVFSKLAKIVLLAILLAALFGGVVATARLLGTPVHPAAGDLIQSTEPDDEQYVQELADRGVVQLPAHVRRAK